MLPRKFGHVHEAIDTAEIHESAEVDDGGHDTVADLALEQLVEKRGADFALGLLKPRTAREDNVVAILIQFDDLGFEALADIGLQISYAAHLHERGREEAAQTNVDDQAALNNLDDVTLDDAVLFLDALDRAPCAFVLCALLGQDQAAFLVLLGEHESLNNVTHSDNLVGINIVLDRQLAGGNDALGLVANIEEHLIPVNLDNDAFDNVAIIEVLDGQIDRGKEVFTAANVVNGNLGNKGLGNGRHEKEWANRRKVALVLRFAS